MRLSCQVTSFLGIALLASCSSSSPTIAEGGTAEGGGGGAAGGSGGAASAGGQVSGGIGSSSGSGGEDSGQPAGGTAGTNPECSSVTGAGLPVNASGWVPAECNVFGIQGSWHCRADTVAESDCTPAAPPFREGAGMCLSGQTLVDATFAAWGAVVGLSLNEPNGAGGGRQPFNAKAAGVIGFEVTVTGSVGSQGLRIGFGATDNSEESVPPFVEVTGAGTHSVLFASTGVPASWDTPTAGMSADPTAVYDIQVQIPGGLADESYDFCVSQVQPIVGPDYQPPATGGAPGTGGSPGAGGTPATGGVATGGYAGKEALVEVGSGCEIQWQQQVPGYYVRNNIWNPAASGQTQCITAYGDPGRTYAGFDITQCGLNVGSTTPASYPSIVKGWHYGLTTGSGSGMPIQVSSIQSVPSTWEFQPPSGTYNVSYDIWLHPQTDVTEPDGGMELMIWVARSSGPNPAGSQVGSANVNGATWTVNQGTVDAWQYLAYVRQGNLSSVDMDLAPFFRDAVDQGWLSGSWYLLGIEAGFEIWNCSGSAGETTAYSVSVN